MLESKKDKDIARNGRIKEIGEKAEAADKGLEERVTNLEKAVVAIGENDKNQDHNISKIEKLIYLAIGLILSFFITFGYKTVILGI